MKKNNEKGFSLVELLVVVIIIAIVAAIAIPNLLASRRAANEASAVNSLRTYHSAQVTYFALNAAQYGTPAQLGSSGLVDPVLGGAGPYSKSGYTFVTTANAGNTAYCTNAAPQGSLGTNFYGVSDAGVIYRKNAAIACAAGILDTAAPAAPVQ